MNFQFNRPLAVGSYKASKSFQAAPKHIAVMFADDCGLVAVTGYADDPENIQESIAYAKLFAYAPALLEKLDDAANALSNAQGEWSSVDTAYAPIWTHELKNVESEIRALIEEATGMPTVVNLEEAQA